MGYLFYNFSAPKCNTTKEILEAGGSVVLNIDGTVSVYTPNGLPRPLTKPCCTVLDRNYTWDANNQECRWGRGGDDIGAGSNCPTDGFNIVLNPVGNDGAIFNIEDGETCILDISFDYLFNFDCAKVMQTITNLQSSLTPEQIKTCEELEIKKSEIETIIETNESNLITLNTTLENTPFVIVCENGDAGGGNGGDTGGLDDALGELNNPRNLFVGGLDDDTVGDTNVKPALYEGQIPSKNLPDPYNTSEPTTPPTAFPVTSNYCLTALGLQSWETILGAVNYSTWFNSNGINITIYGCEEVNQLLTLDGGTGTLMGTCSVGLSERTEIIKQINEIQATLKRDKETLAVINKQIEDDCLGINCNTATEVFENLDVCLTLDVVDSNANTLTTVYEESLFNIGSGNLYEYLTTSSGNTGLFISGTSESELANTGVDCRNLGSQLVKDLVEQNAPTDAETVEFTQEVKTLVQDSFDSPWLEHTTSITDPNIISQISGQKIKISLKIKECCTDFCVLVDRLKLDKNCSRIDTTSLEVSTCPTFDLLRVCDNKKSWLTNEDPKHREFDLKLRDTQYDINNYKLALNSKEVDLDINPANAIEQDMFCYIQDNPCLLDCSTGGTSTISFDTALDFEAILSAETICCDASYTSACTVTSQWNIDVILGCQTIYSNDNFYTSTGISDVPTEAMYITELNNIATELDLAFTTGATNVTFTHTIDCDEISFLDKTFSVNLGLDITTVCGGITKQFQDGENFQFQDGEDYDFN